MAAHRIRYLNSTLNSLSINFQISSHDMFLMNNIKLKRLKCIIYRRMSHFLQVERTLKMQSFMQPNTDVRTKVDVCNFHCSSAMDNFHKFVKKARCVKDCKDSLSHKRLQEVLQRCKSVPEQMDVFHLHAGLTAEDVEHRQAACQDIEDILKPVFPFCSVNIIGSTVTGLGLKGCDLDLSFQTNNHETCQNISMVGESLVLTKEIEEGKIPISGFPMLNQKQKLHFLSKILKESDVVGTIIPGRFPILSFSYKGFSVELGTDNISGLQGTNIMRLCEKLDSRVAPLFRCITYWAKHYKLCGGAMKFKSYGLFLLLVFFLQTKRILPTVELILEKTEFRKNLENWSYDACDYIHRIEKSENVQSTEELLQEFFFFYTNFDFSYVICTHPCELVKGRDFINQSKNDNFELNSISIQDPLNLDWNVTSGVNWKYCRHFAKELLSACEVYQERWTPSSSSTWGLLALIDSLSSAKDFMSRRNVRMDLPLASFESAQAVSNIVYEVFSHCLDFQCSSVSATLQRKLGELKDLKHSEESVGNLVSRFQCVASDTWIGRSNFEFMLDKMDSTCFLDTERENSKQMSLSGDGNDGRNEFVFICECRYNEESLCVTLEPVNSEVFIPKLAIFLKYYILKCINKQFCN